MNQSDIIIKYFPHLSETQKAQIALLPAMYEEWNSKINVISRKDMMHFMVHHVLHSLSIAKVIDFKTNTKIMDVGTGGGFPGIPLAILFPDCQFTLIDSIGKKIKVVENVSRALQLKNVVAKQSRAEMVAESFDFIVSRAVTTLPEFCSWINRRISKKSFNDLENGVIYIKGGDVETELISFPKHKIFDIPDFFEEDFFETKKVVYINLTK